MILYPTAKSELFLRISIFKRGLIFLLTPSSRQNKPSAYFRRYTQFHPKLQSLSTCKLVNFNRKVSIPKTQKIKWIYHIETTRNCQRFLKTFVQTRTQGEFFNKWGHWPQQPPSLSFRFGNQIKSFPVHTYLRKYLQGFSKQS